MATMKVGCDTTPDDSANVVGSKTDIFKTTTTIPLEQLGCVKQLSELTSHLCFLAFQSVLFVISSSHQSLVPAPLCLYVVSYVADDDLLLGITTQFHVFGQCDRIRSHSVAYKIFENDVMASFVFCHMNLNGENEKR
ncbi:hypothetical protein TNCV_4089441 [Trichonephila clavipes]|nr:hypothetical protein TNCV_4089441 [Trichonephila clavipes]